MDCVHQSQMSAWLQKTAVLPRAGESLLLRCPFWSIGCEGLCWTAEQQNILQPNCHKQDWCLQPRCLTLSSQAREGSFGFMELNWGFHGIVFPTMLSLPLAHHYHRMLCNWGNIWKVALWTWRICYGLPFSSKQQFFPHGNTGKAKDARLCKDKDDNPNIYVLNT